MRELIRKTGGPELVKHVDRILSVAFHESLPRTPFLLAALITVLGRDLDSAPPNESALLDALLDFLLGRGDLVDSEGLGMDHRNREHLLGSFAMKFIRDQSDRLLRTDAELHVASYFEIRGIERSVSPGNVLNSLIARRVLVEDADGVGFRHDSLKDLVAARMMLEDPEFASELMENPLENSDVVRHAAALRRTDVELLARVGHLTTTAIQAAEALTPATFFDQIVGRAGGPDPERFGARLAATTPRDPKTVDRELDEHYEEMEVERASNHKPDLPDRLFELVRNGVLLAFVLAGSELVEDVGLKTDLLKTALRGAVLIGEEMGNAEMSVGIVNEVIEELFPAAKDDPKHQEFIHTMVRVLFVVSTGMGASSTLAVSGLATAARAVLDDDEFMSSPGRALYAVLLYCELNLSDWLDRISEVYENHRRHPVLADTLRAIALTRYLAPSTSDHLAGKLQNFIAESVGSVDHSVQERAAARSRLLTRLQQARLRHRALPDSQEDLAGELLTSAQESENV